MPTTAIPLRADVLVLLGEAPDRHRRPLPVSLGSASVIAVRDEREIHDFGGKRPAAHDELQRRAGPGVIRRHEAHGGGRVERGGEAARGDHADGRAIVGADLRPLARRGTPLGPDADPPPPRTVRELRLDTRRARKPPSCAGAGEPTRRAPPRSARRSRRARGRKGRGPASSRSESRAPSPTGRTSGSPASASQTSVAWLAGAVIS